MLVDFVNDTLSFLHKVDGQSKMEKTFFINNDDANNGSCICVGLHTCGNLCSTITNLFVNEDSIKGLCVVGCCYHQLYEEQDQESEGGAFILSFHYFIPIGDYRLRTMHLS